MNTDFRFKHLLSSGRIGTLDTRNRIFMAGMGTNFGSSDGYVTETMKRYHEERARGGVGLSIVEVAAIDYPRGAAIPRQLGISRDEFIPGLKDLTDVIHNHGAKAGVQLHFAGVKAVMDIASGRNRFVPSAPSLGTGGVEDFTPEEMQVTMEMMMSESSTLEYHEVTIEEIGQLVEKYADAAVRAREAGFDGVEVHAAHGYIISMFISPHYNKRTDQYGGNIENRSRLLAEVIRAIKKKAGNDFPVWFRLDAKEIMIDNGITLEDACITAQLAEAAGADAVNVSVYQNPDIGFAFTEGYLPHKPGAFLSFAEQIKKSVTMPVIVVGRIEPEVGDQVIAEGKADFIAMGRKLLADPELPSKLNEGRPEDIRPCIYCYTCVGKIFTYENTCCAVNPATGKEADFEMIPTEKAKKVLVVGAGPGGMEAARVSALRGHKVTLCEKEKQLGGTAFLSTMVNVENGNLINYLETQITKLPIDLRLGKEVTHEFIREFNPDVILVAVGHKEVPPKIPGADRKNVYTGNDLRSLMIGGDGDASKRLSFLQRLLIGGGRLIGATKDPAAVRKFSKLWMPVGHRVVILGGSLVGLELADFFSERGRSVTVLEESDAIAPQMSIPRRWRVLHQLRERGVSFSAGVEVKEILEHAVAFVTKEGDRKTAEADSVILAIGTVPDRDLFEKAKALCPEAYLLGDCNEIGYIQGAMADGARMGRAI